MARYDAQSRSLRSIRSDRLIRSISVAMVLVNQSCQPLRGLKAAWMSRVCCSSSAAVSATTVGSTRCWRSPSRRQVCLPVRLGRFALVWDAAGGFTAASGGRSM